MRAPAFIVGEPYEDEGSCWDMKYQPNAHAILSLGKKMNTKFLVAHFKIPVEAINNNQHSGFSIFLLANWGAYFQRCPIDLSKKLLNLLFKEIIWDPRVSVMSFIVSGTTGTLMYLYWIMINKMKWCNIIGKEFILNILLGEKWGVKCLVNVSLTVKNSNCFSSFNSRIFPLDGYFNPWRCRMLIFQWLKLKCCF